MGYVLTKGFFVKTVGHTFKTDQTKLLHLADIKKVYSPHNNRSTAMAPFSTVDGACSFLKMTRNSASVRKRKRSVNSQRRIQSRNGQEQVKSV